MRLIHVAIVLSLLLTVPMIADGSDADYCSLRLSAVYPTEGFEGFALTNYGQPLDLSDFHVTDGEGTVRFDSSLTISKFECIYFCKTAPPSWFDCGRVILYGQNGVSMKGFALADSGDDIYLMKGDELIDSFVYGDAKAVKGGWQGDPFQKITRKHLAVRDSLWDTDSSKDWVMTVPGRTNYTNGNGFEAMVTPISFPDDYSPLFYALQNADERIDISVYLMSHPRIVSSLLRSLYDGVSVRILVEGSPAGGMTSAEIKALKTLSVHGAEVRVMRSIDGYRAYNYLHNKYAVIDGDTTVITSENWQESSFGSNRGWGAVIYSNDYANYMRGVFESDFLRQSDVVGFNELFPTAEVGSYGGFTLERDAGTAYSSTVIPILSPDNSFDSMRDFIHSAEYRVYSQQLDVDYSWTYSQDCPVSWMKDMSKSTDCRLLVDVTFDDRNDSDYKDGYGVIDSLSYTDISVRSPTFGGLSHNKGVIVDDRVWVGSVNWTENSFKDNREMAVIIRSGDVADYFASLFLSDWGFVDDNDLYVEVQNKGSTFLLEVVGCPEGSLCSWDIDGDGVFETEGKKVITEIPNGVHHVKVSIDDNGSVTVLSVDIPTAAGDDRPMIPMKYYPIIILCAVIICVNAVRWLRGRNDTDKGVQRK